MTAFRSHNSAMLLGSVVLIAADAAGCYKVPTATVTGTVTIDGRGVPGVEVVFVPKAKIRPSIGVTDEAGKFEAQFLTNQSGVPLGDCVVQISFFRDNLRAANLIPPDYNEKAAENPDLHLTVKPAGAVFNYDVKTNGPRNLTPEPDAPSLQDPIPASPSTAEPAAITDDYWHGEFERVNREVVEADHAQVVFFGDSITLGWSIGKAPGKAIWEGRFAKYKPLNMGNSGDITPVMLYRVRHGNLDFAKGHEPKVAVLLCGTNNYAVTQSDGGKVKWDLGIKTPPGDVADGIRAVAQEFRRRLPTTRVILLGILPVKDPVKQAKCQETNRILARYEYPNDQVVFLDVQDRLLNSDGSLKPELYTDGTHLTPKGYEVLADEIEPVIDRLIKAGQAIE